MHRLCQQCCAPTADGSFEQAELVRVQTVTEGAQTAEDLPPLRLQEDPETPIALKGNSRNASDGVSPGEIALKEEPGDLNPAKLDQLSPSSPSRPREVPQAIIVMVNPKSGGNAAGEFMKLPATGVTFDEAGCRVAVFSYAITDPEKKGFKHLLQEVQSNEPNERAMCIVAGGDGTVMWTIEEIFKLGIDVDRVSLGTMPFGTGNDFANVTKWGVHGPPGGFLKESQGFQGLKRYVRAWLRATPHPFDIWEVSVRTHPGESSFEFIDDGKKKCTEKHVARHNIQQTPDGGKEMSKYVCNYFSLGLDARVGVGFDKSRQNNRILNKGVYGWEGTKKLLFKKKGVVGHVLESLIELGKDAQVSSARAAHDREKVPDDNVVFSTDSDAGAKLVGNPVSLIFLNIPSIAGGLDIWNWSTSYVGTNGSKDILNAKQDFGDGRLECLTYRTGVGFYAEQLRAPSTVSGHGHRVYSGSGPLRLNFRDPADEEFKKGTDHCNGRIYMQVDGEFFVVYRPSSVALRHHTVITVLVNQDPLLGCCAAPR